MRIGPIDEPGNVALANTIRGQCQRYQLYERSPITLSGATESRSAIKFVVQPPASKMHAAATGAPSLSPNDAASPPRRLATIVATATAPAADQRSVGMRCQTGRRSAVSAPAPNSHARAGEA